MEQPESADHPLGFAPPEDAPIRYLDRIRDYYAALGYGAPYRWAQFADVPFERLATPLAESRIALVTTAAPYDPGKGEQGLGAPYNAAAKFYEVYAAPTDRDPDLRISHVAIDRDHWRSADLGAFFPLAALRRAAASGRIGPIAPRFFGAPTNRSQRVTLQTDGPRIVAEAQADDVDAAILAANCPVCHQTVTLTARLLEAAGVPTVVLGCAKDIVELVGAPRFVFSDFPLGHAAGRPDDLDSQDATLSLALSLLEAAPGPRATVQSPLRWSASPAWKADYSNPARLTPEEIARRRAEFDKGKAVAAERRQEAGA